MPGNVFVNKDGSVHIGSTRALGERFRFVSFLGGRCNAMILPPVPSCLVLALAWAQDACMACVVVTELCACA